MAPMVGTEHQSMYSETKSDRFLGRQRDSDEFKKKLSINQYCQPSYMGSRFVVSQPELSLWALIFKSKQNLSNLSAFSDFSTQSKAKQHLPTWLTFLNPSESRCRPKNRSDYVSLYILQHEIFRFFSSTFFILHFS